MVSQERRTQIRAAALDLFDHRGYYGTGMEDIARAVGMRASSLYNHYRAKQELLGEICQSGMDDLMVEFEQAQAGLSDPREQLVVAMRTHVHFHALNAPRVRVTNREITNLAEPWASTVRQLRRDYVKRWVRTIEAGVANGDFQAADAKISAYFLIDMGMGVSQWFRPDARYPLAELADKYAEVSLRQLGADPRLGIDSDPDLRTAAAHG